MTKVTLFKQTKRKIATKGRELFSFSSFLASKIGLENGSFDEIKMAKKMAKKNDARLEFRSADFFVDFFSMAFLSHLDLCDSNNDRFLLKSKMKIY